MTHRIDVARGRDIVARWCLLAERRLEYLTELFETGRWRRYHSELAFLENIQEAKAAVEIWRDLLTREASLDNSAVDLSWLGGRIRETPHDSRLRADKLRTPPAARPLPPRRAEIPVEPAPDIPIAVEVDHVAAAEAPSAPAMASAAEMMLDLASIQQRYPLLRNAL